MPAYFWYKMTNKPENIIEYNKFEYVNTLSDSRKRYLRVNNWITSEDFFRTSYFFYFTHL